MKKIIYKGMEYQMEKFLDYYCLKSDDCEEYRVYIKAIDGKDLEEPLVSQAYRNYDSVYSLIMSIDYFIYRNDKVLEFD